jgi:hypothetical protein
MAPLHALERSTLTKTMAPVKLVLEANAAIEERPMTDSTREVYCGALPGVGGPDDIAESGREDHLEAEKEQGDG